LRWQISSAAQDGPSFAVIFLFAKRDRMGRRRAAAPNGINKDWPQP
jgi:hypothetical protein